MKTNRSLMMAGICVFAGLLSTAALAADGYANVGGTTTGGSGTPVTVTTLAQLTSAASDDVSRIVRVSGKINLGVSNFRVGSNKTIIGVGANSGFIGDLICRNENNIILTNLNFSNPNNLGDKDGLTIYGSTHVWVVKCSFVDCGDGSLDITHGSDNVTVSWCKFRYTVDSGHNFVNLIGHSDSATAKATDAGKLHITMHHNWYSTLCKERMPRVRFGRVHCYNNYYGAAGNNYNVGIGNECQVLLETCYFDSQNEPWRNYSASGAQGLIKWNTGNVFVSTTIPTWAPNSSSVFTPPYSYTLTAGSSVKSVVTAASTGAGTH